MSKRKREKMKAKQQRHQKTTAAGTEHVEVRQAVTESSGRSRSLPDDRTGPGSRETDHVQRLAVTAPHIRDMSAEWQKFYAQMSIAARK